MNLSFWEKEEWFTNIDYTIIGSGIVGLSTALTLRDKYPKAKITIIESGPLPQGASTKNAGFACFGSISEIQSDLQNHTPTEVFELVEKRWKGLQLLRNTLGDQTIDFQQNGSYELFLPNTNLYDQCSNRLDEINQLLKPLFKQPVFEKTSTPFGFQKIAQKAIFNAYEGQINTGKMMVALLQKAQSKGIQIINHCKLLSFSEDHTHVKLQTTIQNFNTRKLLITTNGFAKQLLSEDVLPARAQVLITKPIPNLKIKGTFHLDEGYYYFRNINNRILFGGGRNLAFKAEETTIMETTTLIQTKLKELLQTTILPHTDYEIDYAWSGVMGVGTQKKPIVKQHSNHVYCGVRLGGMGVAIGSLVGHDLAQLL